MGSLVQAHPEARNPQAARQPADFSCARRNASRRGASAQPARIPDARDAGRCLFQPLTSPLYACPQSSLRPDIDWEMRMAQKFGPHIVQ